MLLVRVNAVGPLVALFDHPAMGGRGNDNWQGGTPYGSLFDSVSPYTLPLAGTETKSETDYGIDSDSSLEVTIISIVPITPPTSLKRSFAFGPETGKSGRSALLTEPT